MGDITWAAKGQACQARERVERLKAIERAMLASPDQQISLMDPASLSMATSGRGSGVVGYTCRWPWIRNII